MKSNLSPANQSKMASDKFQARQTWWTIVRAYSSSKLTFPSDKLIVISSFAKAMRTTMDDEYIIGMWRRNLEEDLLWFVGP